MQVTSWWLFLDPWTYQYVEIWSCRMQIGNWRWSLNLPIGRIWCFCVSSRSLLVAVGRRRGRRRRRLVSRSRLAVRLRLALGGVLSVLGVADSQRLLDPPRRPIQRSLQQLGFSANNSRQTAKQMGGKDDGGWQKRQQQEAIW